MATGKVTGDFYTLNGYSKKNHSNISVAMEDYLEMIYRLLNMGEFVRVNQLATLLNVTPPSASKMVNRLKENDLVDFQPYGLIQLTEPGKELGAYLLKRHNVLHEFFCIINHSESELELVEKIEHFVDERTILNIEGVLERLRQGGLMP